MKTMKPTVKAERSFFVVILGIIASYSETAKVYKEPDTQRVIQNMNLAAIP